MTDVASRQRPRPTGRTQRFRVGAVIAVAVILGLILWLTLRDTGGSSTPKTSSAASTATAVSPAQLRRLAISLGRPIFWLGRRSGTTYELTQSPNGSIFIRYLPRGVQVGSPDAYLSVATYPFPGAYGAIRAVSKLRGVTALHVPGG